MATAASVQQSCARLLQAWALLQRLLWLILMQLQL
jgi:hypothetical protein